MNTKQNKTNAISDETLERLRELKAERGQSYPEQAKEIGVSWLTLRNWIFGKSRRLTQLSNRKLQNYLQEAANNENGQMSQQGNDAFSPIMQKAVKIMQFVDLYPEAKEKLLNDVECIIKETITAYNE